MVCKGASVEVRRDTRGKAQTGGGVTKSGWCGSCVKLSRWSWQNFGSGAAFEGGCLAMAREVQEENIFLFHL